MATCGVTGASLCGFRLKQDGALDGVTGAAVFHISEISTLKTSCGGVDCESVQSYNGCAKTFHPLSLGQHGKRKFGELSRARMIRTAWKKFGWYGITMRPGVASTEGQA